MILAAYDFGTTGCKGSFFHEKGALIATAYHEYPTYFPHPGWVEQEPDDWKKSLTIVSKQLMEESGVKPSDIACLSFSGHMMGCVPVDENGKPLTKRAFLWADTRSIPQTEELEKLIGRDRFYSETGSGLETILYPAVKIPWIKKNQYEVYQNTAKFVGTKDTICAWLTGKIFTDFSEASDIGLLDLAKRCWHQEFLEILKIDADKMPDIVKSTTVVGKLKREPSQQIGLMEGTPVVIGGGDVSCGTAGAGAVVENIPYMCIGSAGWVSVACKEPIIHPIGRPMTLCHVVDDLYCSQIIMYSAGVAYKWMRDEIFYYKVSDEIIEPEPDAFIKMDQLASSSPPGANGILFLPYMRPGGAPFYNPNSLGAFIGLSLTTKKEDLLRATMEGVAYNIAFMLRFLEENNPFDNIRIIGGGSESTLWKQIFADILQKDIISLTTQQEANTLGAALVGGIGIGLLEKFSDIDRFNKIEGTINPRKKNRDTYQKCILVYEKAFKALDETNRLLIEIKSGM
jgi:xylulokinase